MVENICTALKQGHFNCTDGAKKVLEQTKVTLSTEPRQVCLALVTQRDFGFRKPAFSISRFYDVVLSAGFELCPVEVGPQLRVQYKDQPDQECIHIGMKTGHGGSGCMGWEEILCVVNDSRSKDQININALDYRTSMNVGLDQKFVFIIPGDMRITRD